MTLTVLVIARDEASVIGRCLASLPKHDELIVVDTGSSDDTCEIAKGFGAKIAHYTWVNDFAAARNFAESLATCDYIFWIDADEILAEGHEIVEQIVAEGTLDGVRPAIACLTPEGEIGRPFLRQELLRKRGHGKWKGAIHEAFDGALGKPDARILYHEIARPEGDRPHSWDALRMEAHERSDRGLFYLMAAHGAKQHYVEAIALADYMLNLPAAPNTMRCRAAWMKGHYLRACGDMQGTVAAYLDAIKQHPTMAEPYYYLGELFLEMGQKELAEAWLRASMCFSQPEYAYDLDVYTHLREEKLKELNASIHV